MRLPKFYEQAKPREKVLFGLLLVLLAVVGAINFYDYFGTQASAPPSKQKQDLNPVDSVKPNAVMPATAAAPAPIPLRDPFSVPAGYEGDEKGTTGPSPSSSDTSNNSSNNSTYTPTASPASHTATSTRRDVQTASVNTGYALHGVLKSGSDKMAVVEYNGSSQAVGVNEWIQDYQVVAIGEDYVKLSGSNGTRVLRVQ